MSLISKDTTGIAAIMIFTTKIRDKSANSIFFVDASLETVFEVEPSILFHLFFNQIF
ncbi:MAG: hypothetical protein ACW98D_13915 [Promethearchaeota archaeon]|jgi:hypothetical protein